MIAGIVLRTQRGEFTGWTDIRINRSLEQATGEFSLGVTEKQFSNLLIHEIQVDDRCQIMLHGQTVIDGYINIHEPSYDDSSHSINLSGRDVTGDLVDSSAVLNNGELKNATLDQLAEALLSDSGIRVNCPNPGAAFKKAVVDGGESIFETLSSHAKQRGLLLYTLGDGTLHIGRPEQQELGIRLVEGKNILSANASHDTTQLYHKYIVHSQGKNGKTVRRTVTDGQVRKGRTLVIDIERAEESSLDNLQNRVAWERDVRQAKRQRAQVKVAGWEYQPGKLWNIGQRMHLNSPRLGYNQTMLSSNIIYSANDQSGTITELTLMNPAAYAPQPA